MNTLFLRYQQKLSDGGKPFLKTDTSNSPQLSALTEIDKYLLTCSGFQAEHSAVICHAVTLDLGRTITPLIQSG